MALVRGALSRGWVRAVLPVVVAEEGAPADSDLQDWCCIPCMLPALARREWSAAGDDEELQEEGELACIAVVVPSLLVGIVVVVEVVAVAAVVVLGRGMLLV